MSILVIAAHPDDEVLGCGGTIGRLAAAGEAVTIAILGEGVTSRFGSRDEADPAELDVLRQHSREAGRVLGARQTLHFGLPDNRFDTLPMLEVVKVIEKLIAELRPHTIYTQHGGDLNVDHAVTYRATLTATRPMTGSAVRALYAYEVGSSTEWAFQSFGPVFRPNVFVDVTATLEQKLQAMRIYESEVRPFPHPRSPESLTAQARRWGSAAGVPAAEAFELVRSIL